MAEMKNRNEGTSLEPVLCANGCGFFGSATTMNLCSKCHRDCIMSEAAKAAVEKSLSVSPSSVTKKKSEAIESGSGVGPEAKKEEKVVQKVVAKNRCGSCNKKVGVLGFKCRCGMTYCGSHRYPEDHMCTFDHKETGKEAIAKANPIIKADKLDRFL